MLSRDARYAPYARETALCVEVAYDGLEGDLRKELSRAEGETAATLTRLLKRLNERREVVERFCRKTEAA